MERAERMVRDGVGYIVMNDPDHLNPLDIAMDDALWDALQAYEADPAVRVIVLAGRGRAFSAGGDMRFFREQLEKNDYEALDSVLFHVNRFILQIKEMRKLVIAAVQGHAAGGGACLMMAADFVVADETLRFSVPFTKIGLAPDAGCMYLLSRITGAGKALDICVRHPEISAEEARSLGLVTLLSPQGEALAQAESFARHLAAGPLYAFELAKRQNYAANFGDFRAYLRETEAKTVGAAFRSEDFAESVRAFGEKRPPMYRGK